MARNSKVSKKSPSSKPRSAEGKGRSQRGRRKVCRFCAENAVWVDYKDVNLLRRFMNDRGRIRGRGATGTCAQHQRDVAVAIKTARELAMLPYAVRTVAADPGDRRRGGRGSRGPAQEPADSAVADLDGTETEAGDGEPDARAVEHAGEEPETAAESGGSGDEAAPADRT